MFVTTIVSTYIFHFTIFLSQHNAFPIILQIDKHFHSYRVACVKYANVLYYGLSL